MKLRNKKTGEIVENAYIRESHDFYNKRTIAVFVRDGNHPPERVSTGYETLAELNAEWEDVPEPKEYWFIDCDGEIEQDADTGTAFDKCCKEIGNCFESEEEAKRALEKLKAFERLKDKGFRFIDHIDRDAGQGMTRYEWDGYVNGEDLDLLFGGEE